jgi:hypothetical protein
VTHFSTSQVTLTNVNQNSRFSQDFRFAKLRRTGGQTLALPGTRKPGSASFQTVYQAPIELTRDSRESIFGEALNDRWNARFHFSPLGVDLPSVFITLQPV